MPDEANPQENEDQQNGNGNGHSPETVIEKVVDPVDEGQYLKEDDEGKPQLEYGDPREELELSEDGPENQN